MLSGQVIYNRKEALTFLPGLLRPDQEGALRLHQGEGILRPHPTERVPVASVNRASSVSGALLAFCVNQGRSSLFLAPFTFPIHRRHPPEGIHGSCQGWTPVEMALENTRRKPENLLMAKLERV